ncbi:hypothetical protein ACJVC5_12400 [Peredibacter sp. HCB2-198]|uniref:hypothetical protein n=1 Tax=Peredibacter sp. HCB2-198 TaxID=3383025 RepID=UPI0038B57763
MKIFILLLALSTHAFANNVTPFIEGLKADILLLRTTRAQELHHHIRIKAFGLLGQVMSPDAVATYNGNLNLINLDKTLLNGSSIRDAREIRGPMFATYKNSTIFHELGHAELDVFVEEKETSVDEALMSFYESTLKPFYKKNFPGFNPHTVFHEHFSYYRSDLIDFLYNEVDKVFMSNGFNKMKNSCFLTAQLKKKLQDGTTLDEFTGFFGDSEVTYQKEVKPQYVFVKGKDIDLFKAPNHETILKETYRLFWNYHMNFYGQANHQKELVARLRATSVARTLEACRKKLWQDFQNSK